MKEKKALDPKGAKASNESCNFEDNTLGLAFEYDRRGWSSFPVTHQGKTPATKSWPNDATTDENQQRAWFGGTEDFNIALVTGIPSGIVVMDVDPGHGGDESLLALIEEFGPLPETPEVETGGKGRHFYFLLPGGLAIGCRTGLRPGIDIKGSGGYVVAPPSVHASGRRYVWETSHDFRDIPLALPPAWLIDLIGLSESKSEAKGADYWRDLLARAIGEGKRNDTLAKLAGHLLRKSVDPWVVLALVRSVNEKHCQPPLSEREVSGLVGSVCRLELRRRGVFHGS